MLEGGQVDMQAEEVQEDVGVDLSVGVCCKNYDEPGRCGSAADFLLGEEMEGDPAGTDLSAEDLLIDIIDSNKCQCPPPIVESTSVVNQDQVDEVNTPTAVYDAVDDAIDDDQVKDAVDDAIDDDQVDKADFPTAVDNAIDDHYSFPKEYRKIFCSVISL